MWDSIIQKIATLRNLDSQCQAFGAWEHRYELRTPLFEPNLRQIEAHEESLAGLIHIIDCGCGEERCIVTNGPAANTLVSYASGLLYETGQTLNQAYEEWLEKEILQFRALEDLMRSGAEYQQVREQMDATFDPDVSVGRMIASIANVPLPAELFGDPKEHTIIAHGAVQNPWFEEVLAEWQARNIL